MSQFILHTPRLTLRSFNNSDIELFSAYRSDPLVARYQSWETPYLPARAREFIASLQNILPGTPGEWYQVAVELTGKVKLIGDVAFCMLPEEPRQAEIGITIAREYWGKGFAQEALRGLLGYLFGVLKLHRVRAYCDAENTASAKLLEQAGMRREAHFIENIWFKGKWGSEFLYAILRREWEQSD